jgi:hypothetical protein
LERTKFNISLNFTFSADEIIFIGEFYYEVQL